MKREATHSLEKKLDSKKVNEVRNNNSISLHQISGCRKEAE